MKQPIKRLIRDAGRSLLVMLLIACAAAIAGLGATVHVFTLQQTQAVEDSVITMAVRHAGSSTAESYGVLKAVPMLETLNAHQSVKVPALIRAYAAVDASVTPVYSGDVDVYNWSRDADIARAVMTVNCLEDMGIMEGTTTWCALVQVDAVHVSLPYEIPQVIRVVGRASGFHAQEALVPGESYLLCGRYEDYEMELDMSASFIKGYYDPVYKQDKSEPPLLRLTDWNEDIREDHYMKYIASPEDVQWLEEAVRMAEMNNRMLRLNCINDLNRLRWFYNGMATIVEGRSFTQEEIDSGAQVCIISRALADANGLHVGDTITMNANQPMVNRSLWAAEDMLSESYGFVNLHDFPGDDLTDPRGVDVTLEIVGVYSAPLYKNTIDEFTPNTVFAPYDAVQLEYNRLMYRLPVHTQNLILHNGQGEAFLQAVRDAGYPDGLYTVEVTNYPEVEKVLALMAADSVTLMAVSAAVGVLMLVIILALYARSWRKENAVLAMLGTGRLRIAGRMLLCCALLVFAGCGLALAAVAGAGGYISAALNEVYIGSSMDFSAIRVGAFSEEGMTVGVRPIVTAMGLTGGLFLLVTAIQAIISAGRRAKTCLFD